MSTETTTPPDRQLPLGRTLMTPGVQREIDPASLAICLGLHELCQWGDCCPEDAASNDAAVRDGDRVIGVHSDINGVKFWIITEGDRSVTTALLPEEY